MRSAAAILDAAVDLLAERPDVSVEEIATASGVSRQTVYAHYPSRRALLFAAAERMTTDVMAALDSAEPEAGPADAALLRTIDALWVRANVYGKALREAIARLPVEDTAALHDPLGARLTALIERGQGDGTFSPDVDANWLLASTVALSHLAAQEALPSTGDRAPEPLRDSLLRLYGAHPGRLR
ncbi:TetR/AcrR family transcriptional regulator [Stackebrandtia soli]|uniref:TetR/AcrR family transcriptional regulator n=1 Tax=Stackebrandtia soli TaxID=1892856 RepID=UPI0039EAFBE3